jgi:hypothetical protein
MAQLQQLSPFGVPAAMFLIATSRIFSTVTQ